MPVKLISNDKRNFRHRQRSDIKMGDVIFPNIKQWKTDTEDTECLLDKKSPELFTKFDTKKYLEELDKESNPA